MVTLSNASPIQALGLSSGDHVVRFHVEGDTVSYEVTASQPLQKEEIESRSSGFVKQWSGSAVRSNEEEDDRLAQIAAKHLRGI